MGQLLDRINSPEDLRELTLPELNALCGEIRQKIIETVSQNGGHLASNLGVVELTVALHRVFRMPEDQIVWDVGHQAYTHKILCGRRDQIGTIRTQGGLSGYPNRSESRYDSFNVGHSSTSISLHWMREAICSAPPWLPLRKRVISSPVASATILPVVSVAHRLCRLRIPQ